MVDIQKDELQKFKKHYVVCDEAYRLVYFYEDSTYYIGAFSKTIEGFMVNFCERYPINETWKVPEFLSIDDLLDRCLEAIPKAICVSLYKTDGMCIKSKGREIKTTN